MNNTYDVEFDASGLRCPWPLVKTKQQLKTLAAGQVLRVISTDPSSVLDFKVFAATCGHRLLEVSQDDHHRYVFFIQKADL